MICRLTIREDVMRDIAGLSTCSARRDSRPVCTRAVGIEIATAVAANANLDHTKILKTYATTHGMVCQFEVFVKVEAKRLSKSNQQNRLLQAYCSDSGIVLYMRPTRVDRFAPPQGRAPNAMPSVVLLQDPSSHPNPRTLLALF